MYCKAQLRKLCIFSYFNTTKIPTSYKGFRKQINKQIKIVKRKLEEQLRNGGVLGWPSISDVGVATWWRQTEHPTEIWETGCHSANNLIWLRYIFYPIEGFSSSISEISKSLLSLQSTSHFECHCDSSQKPSWDLSVIIYNYQKSLKQK